jgi:hypothetical protein
MTERIIVPQRQVQGGFDFKFETDPYDVKLHGIMTHQQYTTVISAVNKRLKRARAGAIDGVLLVTGPSTPESNKATQTIVEKGNGGISFAKSCPTHEMDSTTPFHTND